jgi:tRNA A-37 threonylcarbamoyl transferase component Bud32
MTHPSSPSGTCSPGRWRRIQGRSVGLRTAAVSSHIYARTVDPSSDGLTHVQRELLGEWLPSATLVADHSWGTVGRRVLELEYAGARYIAKAGDASDHHLAREIRAHRHWLAPWVSIGRAPTLLHANVDARILVTSFLPGVLVEGTLHEWDPDTYRQAGALLAVLHGQLSAVDPGFEARETAKALSLLDRPHRITAGTVDRLREEMRSWPTPPSILVPTHGDWQPRNWLMHEGHLRIIDLGRADLRPASTDLARLAAQQFRDAPALEDAFLEGYGDDPRERGEWHRIRVREAVGTAVWAHQMGASAFEGQGHRMIAEALSET